MALDVVARVALAPLLAAQAVAVRRQALFLPEPPGPRAGRAGAGPALRLLITGDSAAAGVGADSQDAALSGRLSTLLAKRFTISWRLEAATGATTRDAIARLAALPAEPFDVAVISLGVNDVTRATTRRRWVARQGALHDLLRDRFGVATILASGLPPMGQFPLLPQPLRWVVGSHAARLDSALAEMAAARDGLIHIPLNLPFDPAYIARDGFHPSEAAHGQWARMLADRIG